MDFAFLEEYRFKIKESEEYKHIPKSCKGAEKAVENWGDGYTSFTLCFWNGSKRLKRGLYNKESEEESRLSRSLHLGLGDSQELRKNQQFKLVKKKTTLIGRTW